MAFVERVQALEAESLTPRVPEPRRSEQQRVRRAKLTQMAEAGVEAYPPRVPRTTTVADVVARHPDLAPDSALPGVRIRAQVGTTGRTGVEMEALTAASVAALTLYDMAKALDRTMEIGSVRLIEKTGGKSGDYQRTEGPS